MIDITRFRELILELQTKVNQESEEKINGCFLAVKEEHMVKKIKDKPGVLLCANYPDAEYDIENSDNRREDNQVIFFICEKVSPGSETDEEELLHYAKLQRIMEALKRVLRQNEFCDRFSSGDKMRTEWEYSIFGGFNGLSLGLTIADYD